MSLAGSPAHAGGFKDLIRKLPFCGHLLVKPAVELEEASQSTEVKTPDDMALIQAAIIRSQSSYADEIAAANRQTEENQKQLLLKLSGETLCFLAATSINPEIGLLALQKFSETNSTVSEKALNQILKYLEGLGLRFLIRDQLFDVTDQLRLNSLQKRLVRGLLISGAMDDGNGAPSLSKNHNSLPAIDGTIEPKSLVPFFEADPNLAVPNWRDPWRKKGVGYGPLEVAKLVRNHGHQISTKEFQEILEHMSILDSNSKPHEEAFDDIVELVRDTSFLKLLEQERTKRQ